MKKNLLFTFSALLVFVASFAQGSLWNKTSEDRVKLLTKMERASMPREYKLYFLDFNALKTQLQQAPSENAGYSNVIVAFPDQNGELKSYRIYDAPVVEAGLAAKYPDLKSYIGTGIDDSSASIRFSTTLFGLHVMSTSGKTGTFYIDTYTKDLNNYIVYGRDKISSNRTFNCLYKDEDGLALRAAETSTVFASDGKFRQYRLAMACTIEYAAYHINAAGLSAGTLTQKKAAVLSAMVVTMTRVNGLYERDMSLRMNLIANNDLVIFVDSDNFSNDTAASLIDESQVEIDAAIGLSNYDIGHTVSTGGGGLAQLNSPCTSSKARGITGSPSPVGDPYDIDYVAHEMGHQYGAQHTFNNSCGGNRSSTTAVEPGSGSTIMGYAGICAPDVQSNSDAHFHAVSIAQMITFTSGTGNCAAFALNGNTPPSITIGPGYTIPKGTAFILKPQSVTDVNGDTMTYCWEQTDTAISTQPPTSNNTTGPSFRSNIPTLSQERYMPPLASVLAGNLAPTWEVVSTSGRTYNFALTVRDNRTPNGGQTSRGNVAIVASNTIGPFAVTSQSTIETWQVGQTKTITWNRNSSETLVGSANVDILLSVDGGLTFSIALASAVTNSGTATITVPNVASQTCRLMVRPTGNIYYAVNSSNFYIGYTSVTTCNTYTYTTPFAVPDNSTSYTVKSIVVPTVSGSMSDVNINVNATHPNIQNLNIAVIRPGGSMLNLYNQGCVSGANMNVTFDSQAAALTCGNPTQGTYQPLSSLDAMNGFAQGGSWQFGFRDLVAGNTGTINSISLEICTQSFVLANENFSFDNFSLYPNPSHGSFTVKFNSNTNNNINLSVYDMRGRAIFDKIYQNNGVFEQNLQLANVESGVYLVNIQDGDKKIIKKIIVE
jgi:subtilisin-like proprotein convertase family protein